MVSSRGRQKHTGWEVGLGVVMVVEGRGLDMVGVGGVGEYEYVCVFPRLRHKCELVVVALYNSTTEA